MIFKQLMDGSKNQKFTEKLEIILKTHKIYSLINSSAGKKNIQIEIRFFWNLNFVASKKFLVHRTGKIFIFFLKKKELNENLICKLRDMASECNIWEV